MARSIFINLPVQDVDVAKRFYADLGFANNPQFTDDSCACMVIDDNIFVMLLNEPFFRGFINGDIADTPDAVETLLCLSCDSREQVDETLAKALDAGGKPWKAVRDQGFMYGASFTDPDGHVWELAYMPKPE